MKKGIFPTIMALSVLFLSLLSCSRGGKVIPKTAMSEIYAEMFLADQWILTHYQSRAMADTTFVYGSILDEYGYDAEDYRRSVEHYMQDPDRFARILRQSASIVEARINELKLEQRQKLASIPAHTVEFDFDRILVIGKGLPRMTQRDSMEFFADSADVKIFDPFYRLFEWEEGSRPPLAPKPEKTDTTTVVPKDTVVLKDSVVLNDVLVPKDTVDKEFADDSVQKKLTLRKHKIKDRTISERRQYE